MTENTRQETVKSQSRRALGRGLASLISDYDDSLPSSGNEEIKSSYHGEFRLPVDKLQPSSRQPRQNFNESEILGLSESIKENGLIQPLIIRQVGSNYEIVAGERRWRAAKMAGIKEVPVILREMSDKTTIQTALVENIQRSDLNAIEEARAYKQLLDEFKMTQEDIAKAVGKDRSSIANYLRFLKLPDPVQITIIAGQLSPGHAKVLCSLDNQRQILELTDRIVSKKMSVRETESWVLNLKKTEKRKNNKKPKKEEMFFSIEDNLRDKFKTKVKIDGNYDRGKFVVEYFNKDDFERILSIFFE